MATLTAKAALPGFPVAGIGDAMNVKVATGTYEFAANPTADDVVQMCKVPKGAVVFAGWLYGDDLDTGTEALDIDVGWAANGTDAADPDGFGNLGVLTGDATTDVKPEVSIWYPLGGVLRSAGPKLFSAETMLQLDVNAAANAGGTGTLTLTVLYFMDPNFTV
jgi:hypothetical protein